MNYKIRDYFNKNKIFEKFYLTMMRCTLTPFSVSIRTMNNPFPNRDKSI